MAEIKAIIFDCDGVLVDSEIIFLHEEIKFLNEIGFSYTFEAYVERYMGLNTRDWLEAVEKEYVAKGLGEFPHNIHDEKRKRKWARIVNELRPIPGAREFAQALNVPFATASSSAIERLNIKLELTGLTDLFAPHIYSADFVENGKPAPDLFLYTADKLAVAPENCLVIEDSEMGVKAGIAAGMQVIGFLGGQHASEALGNRLSAAGAHQVPDTYQEISNFVMSHSSKNS